MKTELELGLDELEQEIVKLAYAYVEAQKIAGKLARQHGIIRPKQAPLSPIFPLRKAALEYIGLGEEKIAEFEKIGEKVRKKLERAVAQHPVWRDWAYAVNGLGKLSTGLLMAAIGDITRVNTCSGLWMSFGLHVTPEGKAPRLIPGQRGTVGFPFARLVLGRVRRQFFLRGEGFYYNLYLLYRSYYDQNRPDWPPGRRLGAAIRAMEKILLAHMWEVWRKSKGLPAPDPYIVARNPTLHRKIPPEQAMEKRRKRKK